MARHEILRTTIVDLDGRPVQRIAAQSARSFTFIDLSQPPAPERDARAGRLCAELAGEPIDLADGPLARLTVLRLTPVAHRVILVLHRTVADDRSVSILLGELSAHYARATNLGTTRPPLARPPAQYADYARWQRDQESTPEFRRQLDWWTSALTPTPPPPVLPVDRDRSPGPTVTGGVLRFDWGEDVGARLAELCRAENTTPFAVLLAAFQSLLHRYGAERVALGVPVPVRPPEFAELIGPCDNLLVLCGDFAGSPTFRELIGTVTGTVRDAFDRRALPFGHLVRALDVRRANPWSVPLCDAMFVFRDEPAAELSLAGADVRRREVETGWAATDLTLIVEQAGPSVAGALRYRAALFEPEQATVVLDHLHTMLVSVLARPDASIAEPALDGADRVLATARAADRIETAAGAAEPVHESVRRHSGQTPDAAAVSWSGGLVSYRDLEREAALVADHLRAIGVAGSAVVVRMAPGPRQVAASLGVLRAGGHMVWFGTGDVGERGRSVFTEMRPACLLCAGDSAGDDVAQWYRDELGGTVVDVTALDRRGTVRSIPGHVALDSMAYVAYTSGSTGKPKGIAQSHGAFAQFVSWMAEELEIRPGSRVAQWVAPEHDPSLCEVFATLVAGATLCSVPQRIRVHPEKLADWLATEQITFLQTVPSFARELLKAITDNGMAERLTSLERLVLMGEALPGELANGLRAALPGVRLVNMYGPTETIAATWCEITGTVDGTVPIGRSIPGRQVLVLDEADRPCPTGITGEIVICSPYVARGYIGDETGGGAFRPVRGFADDGLTADGAAEVRCYRTGDLARRRWDGLLEFRGRRDLQIKLQGNRVELAALEAAMADHDSVTECAMVPVVDQDGLVIHMVAYVVPRRTPSAPAAAGAGVWRAHLRGQFGAAVSLVSFEILDRLPRNVAGKVDRQRLPAPRAAAPAGTDAGSATWVARGLAAIWSELLGVRGIGAGDEFFAVGGHSLLIPQLVDRIRKRFGVEIPLEECFANSTMAGMAALIESCAQVAAPGDRRGGHARRQFGDGGEMTLVETEQMVDFNGETLDISGVRRVAEERATCRVAPAALAKAANSRRMFEDIVRQEIPIYGVTTGYGEMIYMLVATSEEVELQTNLVRSHSAGVGPLFAEDESRAIVAARLNALAKGYSAVRPEVLERLALYLNLGITPAIPEIGSLGASGDLAPLAHIASTVIGEGYLLRDGKQVETGPVLQELGIPPLELRFKEGLALINGTSAMTGLGALVVGRALTQVRQAEIVTGLVIEAVQGSTSPFQPEGHDVARPHRGQIDSAANIRSLLHGSQLTVEHSMLRRQVAGNGNGSGKLHQNGVRRTKIYLQKAYSLRAIPQVLGSVRDTLGHATNKLEIELNSANDNPLFFEGREIFHGANFHGQPIAFAMDFVTIALTQLGVLSERQTNRLLNRHLSYGLPEFLVAGDPGLNSGFAGAQYPATALVAENRTIGPASTQSVPSNGDNQDIVSMGLISARNARRVLQNNEKILAVEFLAAAQAVDLADRYDGLSPAGKATYDAVRALVPTLDHDRYMADDIEIVAEALSRGDFLAAVSQADIELR